MGSSLSALQVQHRNELQYLLRKAQHDCPARALTLLLQEVRAQCPWYPEAGSLKLADWERLGQTLHKEPRAPVQALHAWHLCRDVVQRVASDRPSLARLVISPRPSAPAAIPPPGDATQRVASERPSPAPTEGLPIPPPPSAPAAIPPPGDATQRVASERPSPAPTEGLPIPPPPSAPAAIPPPGDATQRVASERPSPAPTEGLPIPPPPSAPAAIPPPGDATQRVASERPSPAPTEGLPIPPPPSAPAAIPPPGDATQRVASERPSPAPTEGLPIPPPPFAPAAIPPPASPPVPLLPPPPWPSPPEPVCDHPPPVGPPGGSSASAQKLSLVQQMVHAAKARSDLTAEELADLVSVCPVTWQNDDQGNPVGTWTTLPYSVVREVKKAIREFGLTSTFVRGLIEGMGTGYSLIPEDWKTLLRMMLSPSQYVIWLSEYRQMAERQAQDRCGFQLGVCDRHLNNMAWHQGLSNPIPEFQLTLETALPPESTTTGRKRRRHSVPSQPIICDNIALNN
ncbi:uncharacterized protein LOC142070245 [Caretta caretta]|uniref:uncharacterized protein LOC142070244 n=1 Tax=Caretta caretta TaxID=8467 RepID=UPI003F4C35D1